MTRAALAATQPVSLRVAVQLLALSAGEGAVGLSRGVGLRANGTAAAAAATGRRRSSSGSSGCRDRTLWPFSSGSIWNHPIGSGAVFAPANLTWPAWLTCIEVKIRTRLYSSTCTVGRGPSGGDAIQTGS